MTAYYNEHDPYAAEWLRRLIAAGHIAPGVVDERSIEDVRPDELTGFIQCHFFAGIGVWSYALRRAGWPDDRPVWTGSCPCQPFSGTGKKGGFTDERHLWPALDWLIQQRRPRSFFGEQVTSKDGLAWLDLVQTDLENKGYAVGAVDLCSAGLGSPNIRQREWFVAERLGYTFDEGLEGHAGDEDDEARRPQQDRPATETGGAGGLESCAFCGYPFDQDGCGRYGCPNCLGEGLDGGVADTDQNGREPWGRDERRETASGSQDRDDDERRSGRGRVGHTERERAGRDTRTGPQTEGKAQLRPERDHTGSSSSGDRPGPTNGFWQDVDWLGCRDGKWRPVEPGTSPLATGTPGRVGRLRAYGNAINAEVATEVIRAYMDSRRI